MGTLTLDQAKERLANHSEWFLDEESNKIYTGFEFQNFEQAIDFVDAVADIAEELEHHPDFFLYDAKFLQIFVHTHDADGITEADFELVAAIDELFSTLDQETKVVEQLEFDETQILPAD